MRIIHLLFARRSEIERLFSVTARAFGAPLPPAISRTTTGRLREFERFTGEYAEDALSNPGWVLQVQKKLFRAAFLIGTRLRFRLHVRSLREAMLAARLVYRGLGIDFRGLSDGTVVVKSCRFSRSYSPDVCRVMSSLDRGLMAGLAYYRDLQFEARITEGNSHCTACLSRRVA